MFELTSQITTESQIRKSFGILKDLGKFRITFFVAITTSFGFVMFSNTLTFDTILSAFAVFLMACGASAINQVQEYKSDLLMSRTRTRPIPSGHISLGFASVIGAFFLISGGVILIIIFGIIPFVLGILTFIWYNLIYTPLKKVNSLAIIPGSLVGAIPPIIGWTAAGGNFFNPIIIAVALFFFIWQIPHFWLLLMMYSNEYKEAGFPVLTDKFSNLQLSRISFVWIIGMGFSSLQILFFDKTINMITSIFSVVLFLILTCLSSSLIYKKNERKLFVNNFYFINIYVLMIILLLTIDKLSN